LWLLLNRENRKKEERAASGEIGEGKVVNDEDVRWIFQT
jgi:hypothetical protein